MWPQPMQTTFPFQTNLYSNETFWTMRSHGITIFFSVYFLFKACLMLLNGWASFFLQEAKRLSLLSYRCNFCVREQNPVTVVWTVKRNLVGRASARSPGFSVFNKAKFEIFLEFSISAFFRGVIQFTDLFMWKCDDVRKFLPPASLIKKWFIARVLTRITMKPSLLRLGVHFSPHVISPV